MQKVLETFEGLGHRDIKRSCWKFVEAHAHQFLLCELMQTHKGKTPTSHNGMVKFSVSFNFGAISYGMQYML